MNKFVVLLLLLVCPLFCCADVQLEVLGPSELLLLNVAVKARLLEKLTEEADKIQFERNELVNRNKACLVNVSSAANECKQCVVNKCEQRGRECQLSEDDLQKIRNEFNNNTIPGVDFLSVPSVVQEEIREIKETAEKEIMEDVPQELKPKGNEIMQKVKQGIVIFHKNLGHAMNDLPELLPRIEENIANIGSNIDMNAVQDMANQAADKISEVIRDPTFTGIRVNVVNGNRMFQENLPSIMQAMGNTLSRLKSAVGQFVGVVRVQAGTAWKQAASNQTQTSVNGLQSRVLILPRPQFNQNQIPNGNSIPVGSNGPLNMNNQPQFPTNNMQFPQSSNGQQFQQQMNNAIVDNRFPNQQQIQFQNLQQTAMAGRKKRQSDVSCLGIRTKLYEACHSYHFYCTSCMNEKTILEHDCGRGALVAMVAIKQLDIQTGNDIVKYKHFVNKGKVIKKVLYDKNSLNLDSGTYSRAYITVHIDGKDQVFGTSILPDINNIKHVGFKLGDELWGKLRNSDENASTRIVQSPEFHRVRADFMKSESTKSSAAITGALWSVMGMIMYMGFIAISVMV